jgi:hypothetical protein
MRRVVMMRLCKVADYIFYRESIPSLQVNKLKQMLLQIVSCELINRSQANFDIHLYPILSIFEEVPTNPANKPFANQPANSRINRTI